MGITSIALSGMQQAESHLDGTARRLASIGNMDPAGAQVDVVDLSEAAVAMLQAKTAFAVNVKAFQAADDMQKEALKVLDPL